MEKATYADFCETLSYTIWKSGLEIVRELEDQGKRAGHFKGYMYRHLSQWEEQGFIKSRKRDLTPEDIAVGETLQKREYLRISTGTPRKLLRGQSGLEGRLVPT